MQTGYLKDRRVSDAAGIIPYIIGSINQAPLKGRGLYIDQPLLRYTPPRVNLKTGAYVSRVAETAAVVKAALNKADIQLIDSIRSISGTPSYTPLAKILDAFKKYEKALVDFLEKHKGKLANNNAVVSTMIIDNLRKAQKGEEDDAKFKRALQGILKQGKETTGNSIRDTLLESNWHLQNEDFSGLKEFDHLYTTYISSKDKREAFKTLKNTMDTNSLTAFVYVVAIYHEFYDTFLSGTNLNGTSQLTVDKDWRDKAFPLKAEGSEKCVPDSSHEKKANSIVGGLIWDILLERFEIFASIVDHVFDEVAGSGSEHVKRSADEFIRIGIIAAVDYLFVTKSQNRTRAEIATAKYKDEVSLLIQEVVHIHNKFEAEIESFLHEDWIVQFEPSDEIKKTLTDSKVQLTSTDQDALGKRITKGLFDSEIPSGGKLSVKDSKVSDLFIDSAVVSLSQAVKHMYDPLTEDRPKSLLTAKEGRSSITRFRRTQERDDLRDYIIAGMTGKAGTGAANILEVFAAKVITTLYNQDPYFAALFLLPEGETAERSNLALKTLRKLGSVFSHQTTTAFDETTDAKSIKLLSVPTGKPETATMFITDAATYKDLFKLSPELKRAYDKALTRAANTNKGSKKQPKKPAPAPQQQNQAQKQKPQQQQQQGQKKGNQRPQSAPPPQKPNNRGGKGKNGGGRGNGR